MSTMVMKLPTTYVDIDRDEMEYVDEGWYIQKTWWGDKDGLLDKRTS